MWQINTFYLTKLKKGNAIKYVWQKKKLEFNNKNKNKWIKGNVWNFLHASVFIYLIEIELN